MTIEHSTVEDIDSIFCLYQQAIDFQKKINAIVVWPEFERQLVEREIEEKRQFKIVIDGKIAAVFAITFSDPEIWQKKNADKAVYIHRIATNPEFRGNNFVKFIVDWAIDFAKKEKLEFVRLDTLGENEGLIKVYTKAGFDFLGMFTLKETQNLPEHYQRGIQAALFEINLNKYKK